MNPEIDKTEAPKLYGTSATKPARRSREEMKALEDALVALVAKHRPVTVRQAFYRATVDIRDLVSKQEQDYRKVQRHLVELRREGRIPYDSIVDNLRTVYGLYQSWDSPEEFLGEISGMYRRDYWRTSPYTVEMWVEKDSIASTITPVVSQLGLPLYVARGGCSESYLYSAAQSIKARKRVAYIYILTDFDPGGVDICRQIKERLTAFAAPIPVHVTQLGVTFAQALELQKQGLTREVKRTDSRAPRFLKTYGDISAELEALAPEYLRQLVRDAIVQHIDVRAWHAMKAEEDSQRAGLRMLAAIRGKT